MTQVIFSIILCKTCIISRHFIVTDTTEIRINLLNKYPKNIWIPTLIKSDFYTNVIVKGLNIQLKTINKAVYGYIILNVSERVF